MTNNSQATILIVNNIPKNLGLLFEAVHHQEYKVLTAEDGPTAITLAKQSTPDLILLDIMMPDMDGYETCRHLKTDETTQQIPVIFVTALSDVQAMVKAFEVGGSDYVTRPFEVAEVMARIKTHLTIHELLLLAGVRKEDVKLQALDMVSLVENVLDRLHLMITNSEADIILSQSWPVVMGYGPWVEEIWANYISNAIKYGGMPPKVELGATVLNNGTIQFWVQDNGEGLSEEDQANLFAEFIRLDEVRIEGHGLGLSIVQRIVEKLGGTAGVESQIGQGSLFYFTLPQATDKQES